jgi:hypothetical protein
MALRKINILMKFAFNVQQAGQIGFFSRESLNEFPNSLLFNFQFIYDYFIREHFKCLKIAISLSNSDQKKGLSTEKESPRAETLADSTTVTSSSYDTQTTAEYSSSITDTTAATSAESAYVVTEVPTTTTKIVASSPSTLDFAFVDVDKMMADIALETTRKPLAANKAYAGLDVGGIMAGFLSGIYSKPSAPKMRKI